MTRRRRRLLIGLTAAAGQASMCGAAGPWTCSWARGEPMDDLSPAGRVMRAAGVGSLSGAVAYTAYSWLWLAAWGCADLVLYEPLELVSSLLTGAAVGFVAGLGVGWRLRSPRLAALRLGGMSAARRLLWSSRQGAV